MLFHTSFPPKLLDENHPVLMIYFVGVSFKWVSFSGDATQAFLRAPAGENPALKHQCVYKSFKKAKGLGSQLAMSPLVLQVWG